MSISNTSILIKRSSITSKPASLLGGELGYSYLSNTIFIGTADGTGVLNVGGVFYTSQIDSATDLNVNGTLVKRSPTGNSSFNYVLANYLSGELLGNANSATQLQTARNFSIDGGDITATAVSFNGTGDVTLNASLDAVPGLSASTYGSASQVPVLEIAANGRVVSATVANISTSLNFNGDSGTGLINLATDILTFDGGDGITSVANGTTKVTFNIDNTSVIRANTALSSQYIDSNLEISGNLKVLGTQTTINVQNLSVTDSLIKLAANNESDILDIGFVGHYYDGATQRHAGVFRHAANKEFYVFDNYDQEPTSNVININDASFRIANVHANLVAPAIYGTTAYINTLNLNNALDVPYGGTGKTSFTVGSILVGNGTGDLQELSNTTFTPTGSGGSSNTITSITVDNYGRFTAATFAEISGLTTAQGGTGASSFTTNGILYGNGSGALQVTAAADTSDQTWSNQILTVTNVGAPVWSTALDGGQF